MSDKDRSEAALRVIAAARACMADCSMDTTYMLLKDLEIALAEYDATEDVEAEHIHDWEDCQNYTTLICKTCRVFSVRPGYEEQAARGEFLEHPKEPQ